MRPEDMNTINSNGKAFNGNTGAIIVACVLVGAVLIGAIIRAIF
jgi:hypothetical protein